MNSGYCGIKWHQGTPGTESLHYRVLTSRTMSNIHWPENKWWFSFACYMGAAGVALGAFGAHGLKKRISDPALLKTWDTAVHYQMLSAFAIMGSSLAPIKAAPACKYMAAGAGLFSGSLYGIVLGGPKILGPVTPMGGLLMIAGWVKMALSVKQGENLQSYNHSKSLGKRECPGSCATVPEILSQGKRSELSKAPTELDLSQMRKKTRKLSSQSDAGN
eukprot:g39608.t1